MNIKKYFTERRIKEMVAQTTSVHKNHTFHKIIRTVLYKHFKASQYAKVSKQNETAVKANACSTKVLKTIILVKAQPGSKVVYFCVFCFYRGGLLHFCW